jgi:hypothetical protein
MSTIEENFERLFSLVGNLAEITAKNTGDITRIESSVQNLVSVSTAHQQTLELYQERYVQDQARYERDQERFEAVLDRIDRNSADIKEMQTEIRGLQTENGRILDRLINENENQ